MQDALHQGGWGMVPTLLFGLIALGTALRFAVQGRGRLLGFLESLSRAVLAFSLSAFFTGVVVSLSALEPPSSLGEDTARVLLIGLRDATHNLALGFTLLSLIHLLIAVGRRRLDAQSTPLVSIGTSRRSVLGSPPRNASAAAGANARQEAQISDS